MASTARRCNPPVIVDLADGDVESSPVVIAEVRECAESAESAESAKSCRTRSGQAFLRAHDGDYELSAIEEQAFLAQREAPHFDRRHVPGTSANDLDPELVALWRQAVRQRSPGHGLARFDDEEMLLHGGVIEPSGRLTVAGLLMLGRYAALVSAVRGESRDDAPS